MRLTIRAELGACAVLALGFGARVTAGDCPTGGCGTGTRLGTRCAEWQAKQVANRYGTSCCPPRLSPGGCYGYFPTQWTPFEAACPGWGQPHVLPVQQPGAQYPSAHQDAPPAQTKPPAPLPAKEVVPAPKSVTPPAVNPPKPPTGSQSRLPNPPFDPLNDRGLILPPVPDIPTSTAPRF